MDSEFIWRLKALNWITVGPGILVSGYLLLSAPATQVIINRREELARVEAITNITELKYYTSGLVMVANNTSQISMVLFWVAVLALMLLVVLAVISIHWLGRLSKGNPQSRESSFPPTTAREG